MLVMKGCVIKKVKVTKTGKIGVSLKKAMASILPFIGTFDVFDPTNFRFQISLSFENI